jgi:membrane dipeptidase
MTRISRRKALTGAASLAALPAVAALPAWAAAGFTKAEFARATVIDALGSITERDPKLTLESPPSDRLLRDLRASGLTAISMTISVGTNGDRIGKAIRKIAAFDEKIAAAPDVLMRIRKAADLRTAKETGRVGLIYNFQDTSLLETDLANVELFQKLGMRVIQLTYNQRNPTGDGCIEPANSGLSIFGRALVEKLAEQRIVMDMSHGGQATIAEAISLAKRPPVISHTGCRALNDVPRNVYDRELRALADKGGVAGMYFMPFLVANGNARPDDLIRHIEHAVNVCGEDHVGLGTDGSVSAVDIDDAYRAARQREFDGRIANGLVAPGESPDRYQFIPEYNEPTRFLRLAEDLSKRGWPSRRIEKVLGGNFARVFAEVWG